MTIGDVVKSYREKNNVSMGEFAGNCGLSKGYISMLENNINPRNNKPISPTLPSIAKIASGMGIELDSLLKMLDSEQPISLSKNTESPSVLNGLSLKQEELISVYDQLSSLNQDKILTYSKSLLTKQQLDDGVYEVAAAHDRTDIEITAEGRQRDLDLMNDDSKWE